VRGRLHGEKGPDGRTKPTNPSLGPPAAAGSPPSPQGRGLRFWLRPSCLQRKIWVEISCQVASPARVTFVFLLRLTGCRKTRLVRQATDHSEESASPSANGDDEESRPDQTAVSRAGLLSVG
jgi:hypothetical protein